MNSNEKFILAVFASFTIGFSVVALLHPYSFAGDIDGQTPNVQILNSSTNSDPNSWVRLSMTTENTFTANDSDSCNGGHNCGYTLQLNTITNGCQYGGNGCSLPWWLQSVIFVYVSQIGKSSGEWAHDESLWQWNGGNAYEFCQQNFPTIEDLTQVEWSAVIQTEIYITCESHGCQYSVSVGANILNPSGKVVSSAGGTCSYPAGDIDYFTQVEGAVVGPAGGYHATFQPLNTRVFAGYIDLVSGFNSMSSQSKGTQTGESSDLFQQKYSTVNEPYDGMYLYSVLSYENTESSH